MFDVTLSIPYGGGMKIYIGLDVTDPEPLPDEHPLWSMSNVIITPHTANTPHPQPHTTPPTHNTKRTLYFFQAEDGIRDWSW